MNQINNNIQHSTLNPQHSTLNTQHSTLNIQHSTFNIQQNTLNPQHSTLNTQHSTKYTQPSTLNTQHSTLNIQNYEQKDLFKCKPHLLVPAGRGNRERSMPQWRIQQDRGRIPLRRGSQGTSRQAQSQALRRQLLFACTHAERALPDPYEDHQRLCHHRPDRIRLQGLFRTD